jgi:hypothetical protein
MKTRYKLLALILTCASLPAFAEDLGAYFSPGDDSAGRAFYKKDAAGHGHEGRCIVAVTIEPGAPEVTTHGKLVGTRGKPIGARIEVSTGFAELDSGCLEWVNAIRWMAATHDGKPVAKLIHVPITWTYRATGMRDSKPSDWRGEGWLK